MQKHESPYCNLPVLLALIVAYLLVGCGAEAPDGRDVIDGDGKVIVVTGATGPEGPAGPQGEAGPEGPQGPAGAAGVSLNDATIHVCLSPQWPDQIEHIIYEFPDGSMFTSCHISYGSYSGTSRLYLYRATDDGAVDAHCVAGRSPFRNMVFRWSKVTSTSTLDAKQIDIWGEVTQEDVYHLECVSN